VSSEREEEHVIRLAPSVLASDFSRIGEEVRAVEEGGADFIHLDIMDGHFVPNLTMGRDMIKAVRKLTRLPLDVHLMVERPGDYIEDFAECGADLLTVHVEGNFHLQRILAKVRDLGRKAGVAINPSTPLTLLSEVMAEMDLLLIMSVNPGFSFQSFIESSIGKIERARKVIDASGREILLEVDGGIDETNIARVHRAGADVAVSGGGVFKAKDVRSRVRELKELTGSP
jgi:ribulose-phosphate 3-epimerase